MANGRPCFVATAAIALGATLLAATNTAGAGREIARLGERGSAAVLSPRAADIHGLSVLAEDIQAELEGDHEVKCLNLSDMDPGDFDAGRFYLMVCSTYGDGELPASAQPFAAAMEAKAPDLGAIHFAIFGMGAVSNLNGGFARALASRWPTG